jgi:hypothetical protein
VCGEKAQFGGGIVKTVVKNKQFITPREKMIERARLYQDTLEELYVKERPTLCGTIHPDHG